MLVSGSGTILEAALSAGVPVALVLADRRCRGLEVARRAGVEGLLVDRREWGGYAPGFDRLGYTRAVTEALRARCIDLVAMAGFGTVLAAPVHEVFGGRVLNTHPSLLPAFPGWHAVADALAVGVAVTGCTVHVATLELDAGPVIAQAEVAVAPDDTVETLHERIKSVERRLYPETILRVLEELGGEGTERTGTERAAAGRTGTERPGTGTERAAAGRTGTERPGTGTERTGTERPGTGTERVRGRVGTAR